MVGFLQYRRMQVQARVPGLQERNFVPLFSSPPPPVMRLALALASAGAPPPVSAARALRETSVQETREVACPDCISIRTEDTKVSQEISVVSAFHTVPSTTVPLIYKRVGGVVVDRDRDDKDCRPQGPGRKPVERGPDGVQAGTVENPNEPTIRKRRQLRCVYWYPRVLRSCTTTVSPPVFSRA